MTLEPWQWALAVLAALIVGISKSGIGGLGILAVVLFTLMMPAKQATGTVLPLLCFGDIVASATYGRHAKWLHVWRLFPWTAGGVVLGWLAFDRVNDRQVVMQLIRRKWGGHEADHGAWFAPAIGVLAGFTTLVANAAGPLMVVYMLAMRLPKLDWVGTSAVFFLLLNLFKVPFMVDLGLIHATSFAFNVWLAPVVLAGAWFGRKLVMKIDQQAFENLALALSLIAGLNLVYSSWRG